LRAEMNDFRADPICRLSEIAWTFGVDSLSFRRILLGFVDLDYCAVENQLRLGISDASLNSRLIGNIEITMFQREDVMLTRQPLRQMASDQSRGGCNQNFHRT